MAEKFEFTVRRATFVDIPSVVVMIYRMHEETGEVLSEAKERYIQAHVMHEFMAGNLCAAVAVIHKQRKDHIIGMALFDIRMHPYGGIQAWGNHLYVGKRHRGGTVAKQLIDFCESYARSCGAEEIVVETEIPALFKRRGYKDSHVVLRKAL